MTHNLAKQVVMKRKSFCSLSVFVSVAAKPCTRSDGI